MLQKLYLVRHAHALDDAPSDAARPLSPKGHKQCERLARSKALQEMVDVELVWQSGLLRARETAEALAEAWNFPPKLTQKNGLAPYDDPSSIAEELNDLEQSCLVAGHEPNLSLLASLLLAGHDDFQRIVFPKASILCLSRLKSGAQATPWNLEWHLSHKHFKG